MPKMHLVPVLGAHQVKVVFLPDARPASPPRVVSMSYLFCMRLQCRLAALS